MNRLALIASAALLVIACGGKPSAASKSTPVTHEHGSTTAAPAADTMDHSAHAAATQEHMHHEAATPGVDHAAMDHGSNKNAAHAGHGRSATAQDHSAMQHSGPATDHAQHDSPAHAQHSATPDAHAHHTPAAQTARPAVVAPAAPRSNVETTPTHPALILQQDAFDAPAPISVQEAKKAAPAAAPEQHTGHAAPAKSTEQVLYTCPMHPEVTSDKPGTCPECGMTLVRKK